MNDNLFEMSFTINGIESKCLLYAKSDSGGHYIDMHSDSGEVFELRPDPGNLESAYKFASPNVPQDLQEQIIAISDVILEYRSLAAAEEEANESPATGD